LKEKSEGYIKDWPSEKKIIKEKKKQSNIQWGMAKNNYAI